MITSKILKFAGGEQIERIVDEEDFFSCFFLQQRAQGAENTVNKLKQEVQTLQVSC